MSSRSKGLILHGLLPVVLVILCVSFLAGCTSIPVQRTASYFENLYKRIAYRADGQYRMIDIFYATSRKVGEKEDSTLYFSPDMAQSVTDGIMSIKIDPSLRIGEMLPGRLRRKGKIGIQDVQKLDNNVFMKELAATVKASPHRSLLVLVFGFKDDFETAAIKAAYFAYLLDINTPILVFSWPGDQPPSIPGYEKAQSYARASGPYLGELLTEIIRKVKPGKIWIQSSSLGCQVVCDAFEHMYKFDDLADKDTEIDHVLLAAPDVGEDEFDHQFRNEIAALSKNLTTYVSSNDAALLVAGLINQDKRLGRQKPTAKEQEQLEEMKDMLYLRSIEPDKIALVDVTPIDRASYGHGYYLEAPAYFDDVYIRFIGKQPHTNRRLYLLKYKDDTDYWLLKGS